MADIYDFFEKDMPKNTISMADIINKTKEIISYIWSKKLIVIIAGVLGAVLGLVSALTQKVDYTATYKFTIESNSNASAGGGLLSLIGLGSSDGASAFSGNNLMELIQSRTMVENALLAPVCINGDSMTVIEYKFVCDSIRERCKTYKPKEDAETVSVCEIEYPLGQKRNTFSRAQDSLLMLTSSQLLQKSISVEKTDKKLNFVNFSFTSKDESFSKIFAAALLKEVNDFYIATRTERTNTNIKSFSVRADSIRKEMDKALYRVASVRDANLNGVAKVQVERLKYETEARINSEAYTEIMKNIEVMKLDLARETPLIKVIDEPIYPLMNNKKGKLASMIKFGIALGFLSVIGLIVMYYIKSIQAEMKEKESNALNKVGE